MDKTLTKVQKERVLKALSEYANHVAQTWLAQDGGLTMAATDELRAVEFIRSELEKGVLPWDIVGEHPELEWWITTALEEVDHGL